MATVTLELDRYVGLLIRANVTDPEQWPEQLRAGAGYLARIREIEAACRQQHGEWDWELLTPELQDEYDAVSAQLDDLRRALDPQPNVTWEQLQSEQRQNNLPDIA